MKWSSYVWNCIKVIWIRIIRDFVYTFSFLTAVSGLSKRSLLFLSVSYQVPLRGVEVGFMPEIFENGFSRYLLIQGVHPVGQLFGRVLRPQTLWHHRGYHAYFPVKIVVFFPKKHENHDFSSPIDKLVSWIIDNSLMNYQKNFSPIGNVCPHTEPLIFWGPFFKETWFIR